MTQIRTFELCSYVSLLVKLLVCVFFAGLVTDSLTFAIDVLLPVLTDAPQAYASAKVK